MPSFKGERIGKLWWRQTWYSICSRHSEASPQCRLCMTGHYRNDVTRRVGSFFHNHFYSLWYWWVNRPRNRQRLESMFPGLKKGE